MYSAGVLICNKYGNNLKFLLGRDSKYKTWSDFGGKNEPVDKMCSKKTACREFYEESCGVIFDKTKIMSMLENTIPMSCLSYMKHDYYMYVLYIDDDMSHTTDFANVRNLLLESKSISFKYLEKDRLNWIDLDYILNNRDEFRCVFYTSLVNNLDRIMEMRNHLK
jgi:hypothetical protein